MSDDIYQIVVVSVLAGAFMAQIGFAGYYVYRRQWRLIGRIAVAFIIWFVSAPLVFLFGVGACANGCPGEPFEFILFTLICMPSFLIVCWLLKRSRRQPDGDD